jgi:hypothetical protein
LRPQPLLCVRDVEASARWYEGLLGARNEHGGSEYARLYDGDRLILQLHDFEVDHHHGRIGDPALPLGNGVLVWFETEDFEAAMARVEALAPPASCRATATPTPCTGKSGSATPTATRSSSPAPTARPDRSHNARACFQ